MVRCGKDKSGKTRLKCSLHHGSKSCPNPKSFYAEDVEALVIASLTKELASPLQIYSYAKTFMEERHVKAAHENQRRKAIESRLKGIERESAKLVDLMIGGIGDVETLGAGAKSYPSGEGRTRFSQRSPGLMIRFAAALRRAAIRPRIPLIGNTSSSSGSKSSSHSLTSA